MIKFSTETHGKKDAPRFLPADLKKNFAKYTGRVERTDAQIEDMVQSLLAGGQKVPITVRRGDNDKAIPVTGHTRILAADIINKKKMKGYRLDVATGVETEIQYGPDAPFLLDAMFQPMNETEALFSSFVENATRNGLTDMDYVLFLQVVENLGMTDADIARKIGKPASFISNRRKVLELDTESQRALAKGEIKFDAVHTLGKVASNKRKEVIATAKAANGGRATASGIAKAAAAIGAVTAPIKRSDADVKAYIDKSIEETVVGPFQKFLFGLKDYRAGTISEAELDELRDAVSESLTEA
jgi:ParB-like chromosome segregation protein Spo0J